MSNIQALAKRLRELGAGREEWRVQDPEDGSYCIAYCHSISVNPEREAREWLARVQKDWPDSTHAGYVVARVMVQSQADEAMQEAADLIEQQAAELEACRASAQGAEPVAWVNSAFLPWLADPERKPGDMANAALHPFQAPNTVPLYAGPAPKAEDVADATRYRWLVENKFVPWGQFVPDWDLSMYGIDGAIDRQIQLAKERA